MQGTHIQLKALVFMLVLILGFSVFERADSITAYLDSERHTAGIFNPVAAFLGIQLGGNNRTNSSNTNNTSQHNPDAAFNAIPDDPFGGLNSNTIINTPAPNGRNNQNLSGGFANTQSGSGTTVALNSRTPTLVCVPNIVDENEEVIIMWACRDGAYKTTSANITTNDATIGSVRVSPSSDTTYTLECVNNVTDVDNTSATCDVEVANPALAIIATPRSVTSGGTVSISWKTKDTNSCVISSDQHRAFEKRGIEGDALSPTLIVNTVFTVTCESITGVIEERSVSVGVN
ncbi:MAG: hypothetical protein JKX80_02000 [Candidatus Pacebacteria bacterium]|nr:hypothetical protein [Candidatus Paceibacterota bacterium]